MIANITCFSLFRRENRLPQITHTSHAKVITLRQKRITTLIAAVLLAGCANTNISKEMQLTAGGVAAGAIAGAQVGGVRGAIVGGIIGGVVGNRIGAYLDEEDKKKLALLEIQAFNSGKEMSFVSNKSKAKVTVTPQETKVEPNPDRTFSLPPDVAKQQLEVAAYDDVKAFVDTPVYRDTNEKSTPKQVIKTGGNVQVAANVINKEWGAVVDGNNVVGYVPLRYLNKDIQKKPKETFAKAAPPKPAKTTKVAAAKNGVSKAAKTTAPQAPTSLASTEPASTTVQASRVCRVILHRLDPTDSSAITEERRFCRKPPKGVELVDLAIQRSANA